MSRTILSQQRVFSFAVVILALIILAMGALLIGRSAGDGTLPFPAQPTPTATVYLPGEGTSVQLGTFLPPTPTPTPV